LTVVVLVCTAGCRDFERKAGDPAPAFEEPDFDDYFDASTVLMKIVGPPPPNVVIRRWRWDTEKGENVLDIYPPPTTDNEGGEDEVEDVPDKKPHGS